MRAAVAQTRHLVTSLLLQDIPEDEILNELRRVPGGERTLRRAAKYFARLHYWPATRANALLLAAADGREAPAASPEDKAEVEDVHALMRLDTTAGFAMLTERVPALRELEASALDPQQAQPSLLGRRGPPDLEQLTQLHLLSLVRNARTIVGPRAAQTDRLAASPAAFIVVVKHLHALLGVPHPGD